MSRKKIDPKIRFEKFVVPEPNTGCWLWIGQTNGKAGYGIFDKQYAHRASYEFYVGEIPKGLDLDHLCRNRICCNPAHLEPVTRSENLKRGNTGIYAKEQAEKRTHCKNGHEFSKENTSLGKSRTSTYRVCKECKRNEAKERRKVNCMRS